MDIKEGHIYESMDELYIVEKVYNAKDHELKDIILVKCRCIDPMPRHIHLDKFETDFEEYNPDGEQ